MDNQNQGANQQVTQVSLDETKQKKSKRTTIIFLLLTAVIVVSGISMWLSTYSTFFNTQGNRVKIPRSLPIQPEDQACTTDADCVIVGTECSSCSCGAAVNKTSQQKYERQYINMCKNYKGGVCEFYCTTPHTRCINNSCVLSASPAASDADMANWKTYTNEAYNYQVKYPSDWEVTYIHTPPTPEAVSFLKRPGGQGVDVHDSVINIIVEPNPKKYSPTVQWYKEVWASQIPAGLNFENLTFEETSFKNLPALKVSNKVGYDTLFFARDTQIYRMEWYIVDYGNADYELIKFTEQIFDQILSTFKFLN